MRLNPVYRKELKQSARMKKTILLLVFYNGLLSLFGLFAFYITFEGAAKNGGSVRYADILNIYCIITGIEFMLLLFIVPALTAGAISGEREKQTLDILLTTKVSAFGIVWGKLAASISLMILLAFSSLPVIAIVFSVGGITPKDLFQFVILILVTAIFLGSIGIYFSARCLRTTAATVCTYSVMLAVTFGVYAVLLGISVMRRLDHNQIYGLYGFWNDSFNLDVGYGALLLLIDPLVTFLAMVRGQVGIGHSIMSSFENENKMMKFVLDNWFIISCIVQCSISGFLLFRAAKRTDTMQQKIK